VSDLVARLHFLQAQVAGTMRESVVEDALDRIKTLESELAQTKRNMTHVEDCWGNIQSALGETEAELAAMTKRALNGEAAIATLMDVINTQKARLPYSQAAHLTTLEAELAAANAKIEALQILVKEFGEIHIGGAGNRQVFDGPGAYAPECGPSYDEIFTAHNDLESVLSRMNNVLDVLAASHREKTRRSLLFLQAFETPQGKPK